MHAGARPHIRHHLAQPLDGFLGQLVTHLREGTGPSDGGLGLKLGGLHDLLADGLLVRLVGQRGLGDFAAQAHGALTYLAHDVLLRLEEAAQRTALVVIQVTEEFLRVELLVERRISGTTLAFAGAKVTALTVHRTAFAALHRVTPEFLAANFFAPSIIAGADLLAAAFIRAEVATRRALALGGAFLTGAVLARTIFTGAFLSGDRAGQGREGKPAQRREQRAGDNGQFHSFFLVCRAGSITRLLRFNAPAEK